LRRRPIASRIAARRVVSRRDEHRPHRERGEDSKGEHPLLVLARHRERGHDHQEDEQVVDRQALLDDVAGEVLGAVAPAGEDTERDPESDRDPDVEDRPSDGLAELDCVRPAAGQQQVDREQPRHQSQRGGPGLGPYV
jgi:hypothetical protein